MFKLNFQYSENITKADVQFAYTLSYQEEKKGLHIRLFLGNIFDYKANPMVDYSYKLSSWDGGNDYLYDHTYLGRSESEGLLASQMYSADGGFYLPSALGRSWGMIGAINLRTSLPFTRLINLYANGGITDDGTGLKPPQSESLQYEGGAVFTLLDEAIEVYFPILWSKEYQRVMDLNPDHNYWKNVRFTLKMDLANPFKALKELHL
jgi:hypothetical protein